MDPTGDSTATGAAGAAPVDDPVNTPIKPSLSDPMLGLGTEETPTAVRIRRDGMEGNRKGRCKGAEEVIT